MEYTFANGGSALMLRTPGRQETTAGLSSAYWMHCGTVMARPNDEVESLNKRPQPSF